MSLNLVPSKSHVEHPDLVVSGQWIQTIQETPELVLEYRHTVRKAPVLVDCGESTRASAQTESNRDLLDETQNEDGQVVYTFAGEELLWNNKWRRHVIEEGLDKFVPQVLYLVRPETAYISCLHFLARELGGMETYPDQRSFIFRNPGMQALMGPFWEHFQKTYWSGGFNPGIGEEDRLLLILALIECHKMTVAVKGETGRVPCPHVPLEHLHNAGIYLPALEFPELIPTDDAIAELNKAQNRANLPGLPNPLGSYIECYACVKSFTSPDDMAKHKCISQDELKCTGCGLQFDSDLNYKVHALTFCHEGPLTRSKCSICGSIGPACICATHWKRTFALVSSLMEGTILQAGWLSDKNNWVSLLIAANVYLDWDLVAEPRPPESNPPVPTLLPESLWNLERLRLPQMTRDRETKVVLPHLDQPLDMGDLLHQLHEEEIEFTLPTPTAAPREQIQRTPNATLDSTKRIIRDKHIGTGGIVVENAGLEELEFLETRIKLTECKLAVPDKAAVLARMMGMEIDEVQQGLDDLKDLATAVAIKISAEEEASDPVQRDIAERQRDRAERLKFVSPLVQSRGGSQGKSPVPSTPSPSNPPSPSLPPRRTPRSTPPLIPSLVNPRLRRSASKSPGRTATSVRGSSKTHTMFMVLQRAMQVMRMTEVVPKATSFKRKYDDLKEAIRKAEGHLRYEDKVDPAYAEELDELLLAAEEVLDQVDDEMDQVNGKQEEERRKEAQIAECLPRSSPQKWDGSIRDFIKFKEAARVRVELIPDPRLAMDAIVDLISDTSIKKRLARYKNPAEALNSLELQYGNPELSGPKIINDMKELPGAANTEAESSLIMKIKDLYVSLTEIKQEQLLGRNELYGLCHKLSERNGKELLQKLSREDPDNLRKVFFHQVGEIYTNNTIWSRTGDHKDGKNHDAKRQPERSRFKANVRKVATGSEPSATTTEPRKKSCNLCKGEHWAHECKEAPGMTLKQLKEKGLCGGCLKKDHKGSRCYPILRQYQCHKCRLHLALTKMHVNCKKQPDGNASQALPSAPAPPQQEVGSETNNRRHKVGVQRDFAWRSPGGHLSNPNPANTALELVDHCIIQAPDGRYKKCRVIHDAFGADSTLADVSLESFSHRTGVMNLDLHTANGTTKVETDEMVLKIIMPDGRPRFVKTIATEMRSQRAFQLVQKCIDAPCAWNQKHFNNRSQIGQNHNLRFLNFTEGPEIELLLGADLACLSPIEVDRFEDAGGGVVLYRSCLQTDIFLLGGSRLVGPAVVPTSDGTSQRGFRFTAQDGSNKEFQNVLVRRTVAKENEDVLFPENPLAKMSKLDRKFFKEFEDSNLLLPHPRACAGCAACPTCSDVGASEKRMAIEKGLDGLCHLDTEKPWPEGGWHVQLMWNALKEKVPDNEQDAIRRFLATEKSIAKSPSALKSFNDQIEKCLSLGYFVLEADYQEDMTGRQVSFLPLSYALKDKVDDDQDDDLEGVSPAKKGECKTKARPVSDASHRSNFHTPSVNDALVPLTDLWTEKIQPLLLKFRTAKQLALGDISQYFHRLRLDLDSVSMTRVIWRKGGIGGSGQLTTMFIPSASMGLTPVPALASHCRARTADMIDDPVAQESIKKSYVDDLHLATLWDPPESQNKEVVDRGPSEPNQLLITRIQKTEAALQKAKLDLGSGWMTDLPDEDIPPDQDGITGVTAGLASRDIGLSTGALGLRWNVGNCLPEGGTFSYRVNRPGSINLLPKKRGKRPPEGELRNRHEIENFLSAQGITKAGVLSLVMNLFDVLGLALPWTATAKILYREILTENPGLAWKQKVASKYHPRITDLAADLLILSREQSFPRRALHPGPDSTIGFVTLILCHDGSADSASVLAYVHQQWPRNSVRLPSSVTGQEVKINEEEITTRVSLLCGAHKMAEHGKEEQVCSELLSSVIAVKLKKVIYEKSLVKFDNCIYLGDSLTVARILRKSNRAFSPWAASRVAYVQRNEDVANLYHVPGSFLQKTADKATRAHASPSSLMDSAYWEGTDSIDVPIHKLPITPPSQYITKGLDELPQEWLHKATLRLNPVGVAATLTCHRIEVEEDDHALVSQGASLDRLKIKYRSLRKITRVMKIILSFSPALRCLSPSELWTVSELKWISLDHDIVRLSLTQTKVPQSYLVREDKKRRIYYVQGRSGYRVPILANPRKSRLTRVVLKQFHDDNHGSSPATVQALLFKEYYVMGGAAAYIKKIQERCARCRLWRAAPSESLMGKAPYGTQGPTATDQSIWRRIMVDLAGPIILAPWAGRKDTRGAQKSLKHWLMVAVDLASRQVDCVLLEGYHTSAVQTGLRELLSRHGVPTDIYWDRAANLRAAAALMKGDEEVDASIDMPAMIKMQEDLKRSFELNGITVHLSIPFSPHRQGRVESAVKLVKTQLKRLCYQEHQTKLTPLEACSILAAACSNINNRPLVLTCESSLDEKKIMSPSYLTCADLNIEHTSHHLDPETQRSFNLRSSPLNRRAMMVQERIEVFKNTFEVLMTKSLVSLGKFNRSIGPISRDDVVLILDKKKTTLPVQSSARYTLGVVEKLLSDRSFSIRYMNNKKIDRCERSIQGLSVIVKATDAKEVGTRDIVIDPLFPAGNLIDLPKQNTQPKGGNGDNEREQPQCKNVHVSENDAENTTAAQPKRINLKFVRDAEEMIQDLKGSRI